MFLKIKENVMTIGIVIILLLLEYVSVVYLDGNKDLIIGMQGMIINQVNASGDKTEKLLYTKV